MKEKPKVSFVIIGFNEEDKIAGCIDSILQADYPAELKEIIYVDNNSTDKSVEIARRFPIRVIELKEDPPTPGLARNAGMKASGGELIQFVDGDMMIDPDWLRKALPAFAQDDIKVVVGRLKEQNPDKTIYNGVVDLGWKTAELGSICSPGGGGLFRTAAIKEIGGYDSRLRGAEEIDLGYRLRQRGYRIVRIPACMALHDIDMTSWRQFWRRGARDGYWEMVMIRRYFKWALPLPQEYILKMDVQLLCFALLLTAFVFAPSLPMAVALSGLPSFFTLKKIRYFHKMTGQGRLSMWAGIFNYLNMLPIASGQVKYLRDQLAALVHAQQKREQAGEHARDILAPLRNRHDRPLRGGDRVSAHLTECTEVQ